MPSDLDLLLKRCLDLTQIYLASGPSEFYTNAADFQCISTTSDKVNDIPSRYNDLLNDITGLSSDELVSDYQRSLYWPILLGMLAFDSNDVLRHPQCYQWCEKLLGQLGPWPTLDEVKTGHDSNDDSCINGADDLFPDQKIRDEVDRVTQNENSHQTLHAEDEDKSVSESRTERNVSLLLTEWITEQMENVKKELNEQEIAQIDKDVGRSTSLYPPQYNVIGETKSVRQHNQQNKRERSDTSETGIAKDKAIGLSTSYDSLENEIRVEADQTVSNSIMDKALLKSLINTINKAQIPITNDLSSSSISEWNENDVLSYVIKVVVGRHSKARGIMYTQGLHEVTIMILRINNIFTIFDEIRTTVLANERKAEENNRFQETEISNLEHLGNLLILQIFKSVMLLERLCLHHLSDFLAAPLELSLVSYLKIIGYVLWGIDPPLFSLLTFLSQYDAAKSGRLGLLLSKQNNPPTRRTLHFLPKNSTLPWNLLNSIISNEEINSQNFQNSTSELWPSNIHIPLFLSGHEFQFCLSWLLTLFSHDLLPSAHGQLCFNTVRYELATKIWDNILSAPPQFIVYLCVAIIRHPKIRICLINIAQQFGIVVEDSTQQLPLLERQYEEQKILDRKGSDNSCSKGCRYPPGVDLSINELTKNDDNVTFEGLRFDHNLFDSNEIDFMQIEIFKLFQDLFKPSTIMPNPNDLKTLIDDSIHYALQLMSSAKTENYIANRNSDGFVGYDDADERGGLRPMESLDFVKTTSLEMSSLKNKYSVANHWPLLIQLTSFNDPHCSVPLFSSIRQSKWRWRLMAGPTCLTFGQHSDDLEFQMPKVNCKSVHNAYSVMDCNKHCGKVVVSSYVPLLYKYSKQNFTEILERRRCQIAFKKRRENEELSLFLRERHQSQSTLSSIQHNLFISLLSGRFVDRLLSEWIAISKRLVYAIHLLIPHDRRSAVSTSESYDYLFQRETITAVHRYILSFSRNTFQLLFQFTSSVNRYLAQRFTSFGKLFHTLITRPLESFVLHEGYQVSPPPIKAASITDVTPSATCDKPPPNSPQETSERPPTLRRNRSLEFIYRNLSVATLAAATAASLIAWWAQRWLK